MTDGTANIATAMDRVEYRGSNRRRSLPEKIRSWQRARPPETVKLTRFAVPPVVSVLGKATEEQVQDEQQDRENGAHGERHVERLVVAGLVLAVQRVSRILGFVVQDHWHSTGRNGRTPTVSWTKLAGGERQTGRRRRLPVRERCENQTTWRAELGRNGQLTVRRELGKNKRRSKGEKGWPLIIGSHNWTALRQHRYVVNKTIGYNRLNNSTNNDAPEWNSP